MKYRDFKKVNEDNRDLREFYLNKYFAIYQQAYRFKGLSEGQDFFLKQLLYYEGSAMLFTLEESRTPAENSLINISGSEEQNSEVLLITPYATTYYNMFNEVTKCYPVKRNGSTFVPLFDDGESFNNNVNCVIMYSHTSHKPIYTLIDFYIDKIVEVEKAIRMNVEVNKLPRLIVCSPTDRSRVQDLFERIRNGSPEIFVSVEDVEALRNVLDNDNNYIIDKLFMYKQQIENELLTFLGIDNVQVEKRERLINAEVESNNDSIRYHLNCFLNPMREACERVKEVLGYELSVTSAVEEQQERAKQDFEKIMENSGNFNKKEGENNEKK